MNKIKLFFLKFFAKKYFITEIEEINYDEVLVIGHRIYVKKK